MSVVAVAGGLGDMGRLITSAILETGKHEVYVLSRKVRKIHHRTVRIVTKIKAIRKLIRCQQTPSEAQSCISPLTGKSYDQFIMTDYSSKEELVKILESHNIQTVICAIALDFQAACDSQVTLIQASELASTVQRFIPSEFNVDYDLPDEILPYPDKRYHTTGRRELEKTNLEFTYIYPGMFMDYFAMPYIETHMREIYLIVDADNGVALVPGDGKAQMAMSYTKDVARYMALALELDKWPRVMTTVTSTMGITDLVTLIEGKLGRKLKISYQPVEVLRKHENQTLPRNLLIAEQFPGGVEQLNGLTADLEASIALGAYDFASLKGEALNLVDAFEERTQPPMTIERLLELAAGRK